MFAAMVTGNQVTDMGRNTTKERNLSQASESAVSMTPPQTWKSRDSNTSSEAEKLMLEEFVEASRRRRRTVSQYIKMLSVIALPIVAVICLVSLTVHSSRVERGSQLAAVQQFEMFANIEALVTSMRAERGYTTSVVILGGQETYANEVMFKQRSHTDYILLSLPVWPDGLAVNDVELKTRANLGDTLNELRGRVSTHSVSILDVLDFYSAITEQLMYWLLVIRRLLLTQPAELCI